jgi:hypothetical protein
MSLRTTAYYPIHPLIFVPLPIHRPLMAMHDEVPCQRECYASHSSLDFTAQRVADAVRGMWRLWWKERIAGTTAVRIHSLYGHCYFLGNQNHKAN